MYFHSFTPANKNNTILCYPNAVIPTTSLFLTTNHVCIGFLHILYGLIGGSFGYGLSLILRIELTLPGFILCSPPQYNPIITFHGLFTTSFMIMPILIGGFGIIRNSIKNNIVTVLLFLIYHNISLS